MLSDPRRDPGAIISRHVLADVATFGDKLRTLKLAASNIPVGVEAAGGEPDGDSTSLEYLREQGSRNGL